MLTMSLDLTKFNNDMKSIMAYSTGFLEGAERAKPALLQLLGARVSEMLKNFIDSNARVNPEALHHVYEWYQTGSPNARLFDIQYIVTGGGLSISSSFSQSRTIKSGSKVPFYNKASIMENGLPVTIVPRTKLVFEADGETVFTPNPVTVQNPGGKSQGEFQRVFDLFFDVYLKQSFLNQTGILSKLNQGNDFKDKFASAKRGGRSLGIATGYNWMLKAGKE
jgi:hypothetical protein